MRILFILTCCLPIVGFCQKSPVVITISDHHLGKAEDYTFVLVNEEEEIVISERMESYGLDLRDTLQIGFYTGYILYNSDTVQINRNLEVKAGVDNYISIRIPGYYVHDRRVDTTSREPYYDDQAGVLYCGYAGMVQPTLPSIFTGMTSGFFIRQQGTLDLGAFYQGEMKLSFIRGIEERYFYLSSGVEVLTRLRIKWDYYDFRKRFWIDVGVNYKVPLIFRRSTGTILSNKKYVDRRIHRFKDFNLIGYLGIGPVSIMCQYRLEDFVMGDRPELPRWSVGLGINVPGYFTD